MEDKAYKVGEVLSNDKLATDIYKVKVKGDFKGRAGQFYMLRAWGEYPLLSRPISIYDVGDGFIEFLYAVVGEGTRIISELQKGDNLELLGPLGNGFDTDKTYGKVALVCGGIGIAPLLYLAKNIKACKLDLLAGFRDEVYCVDEFEPYAKIKIATEDGSVGERGFVTRLLENKIYDALFVCGPTPMMKAVAQMKVCEDTFVSLEAHMGCAIGACLGCQVEMRSGEILRICHEGPVFKAGEVVL